MASQHALDSTPPRCALRHEEGERASSAARLSGISTKPNPRERPVSRSVIIRIVSTVPYGSKSWRRSCSVVVKARLPTKIFTHGSPEERVHTIAMASAPSADTIWW